MNIGHYIELRCHVCGYRETVGLSQMIDHLHSLGMLKRQKDPEEHLVRELFAEQIPLLRCRHCGEVGYDQTDPDEFDDAQWGGPRKCEVCGDVLSAERLEVFPDARRCTRCQQAAEQGEDLAEPEYCPRCGAIMHLRQRGGAALAGYVMRCPECGYK